MIIRRPHAALFVAAMLVAACDFQKKGTVPTTLSPTPTQPTVTAAPSMLGTWSTMQTSQAPIGTGGTCSNFVWTITSQTDTDVAGTFTAVCLGSANVAGSGTGHISGSNVTISITGNGSMPGLPS